MHARASAVDFAAAASSRRSWPIGIPLVSRQPLGTGKFYMALAISSAIIAAGIDYRRHVRQAEGKDTAAEWGA